MQKVFDFVLLGNASVSKGFNFNDNYLKVLGTGWYMAYFFFNQKNANLESKRFFIKPSSDVARKVKLLYK